MRCVSEPAYSPDLDEALNRRLLAYAHAMWRLGRLSWKCDPHQLRVYDKYRAWEAIVVAQLVAMQKAASQNGDKPAAQRLGMLRCFVLDIGRRWGKTFLVALIRIEDCLRRPRSRITYATAFEKDIIEIIQPMIEDIIADAPDDCRPVLKGHKWHFPNGSTLRMVGVDKNPKGLRGQASDGFNFTEAGYIKNLGRTIGNVIYAQFQRRPWATCILESNAPEDPDHDFDLKFIPDAKRRDAYVFQTIDDNEVISDEEKQEQIQAVAEATSPEDAQREFYGKRFRDPKRYVIPNFVDLNPETGKSRHVYELKRPNYAKAYTCGDPGTVDLFGLLFGYWHFEKAKLVIERDWAAANAPTFEVAKIVRQYERELWGTKHREPAYLRHQRDLDTPQKDIEGIQRTAGGLAWKTPFSAFTYWDGREFVANPADRFCDNDKRVHLDMAAEHELQFNGVDNSEPEALSNRLRTAFERDQIVIHPSCVELRAHLQAARWDENRRHWERHARYGHYDLVAVLMYMWASIDRVTDPNPPVEWDRAKAEIGYHPGYRKLEDERSFAGQVSAYWADSGRDDWR